VPTEFLNVFDKLTEFLNVFDKLTEFLNVFDKELTEYNETDDYFYQAPQPRAPH
jgi:hypothetical protein